MAAFDAADHPVAVARNLVEEADRWAGPDNDNRELLIDERVRQRGVDFAIEVLDVSFAAVLTCHLRRIRATGCSGRTARLHGKAVVA
jgi:hypothetical protein